jgi:hypothetical protein
MENENNKIELQDWRETSVLPTYNAVIFYNITYFIKKKYRLKYHNVHMYSSIRTSETN